MDKYEYRVKTEQMLEYAEEKSYKKAMDIADTIDWRKVRNTVMLTTVSEIYENMEEYGKARDLLYIAYDKAPTSRKVVYRMGILSIKMNQLDSAMDCYEEFVKMAPKDPNQYILRYKILRAQHSSLDQQIDALETFKRAEYIEKWAFELAELYSEAGMISECLEECDDLILWFSEGKYVYKAMELKMKYKPLTPLQQEKYDGQSNGMKIATMKKKAIFKKPKERPVPDPRISQKIRENVHVTGSINLPDLPEPMVDMIEPDFDSLPEEHVQSVRPRTKIENTSKISTTITGTNLADILKTGVAMASGKDPEENKPKEHEVTGQMKIEEILANWEETQRENAKIIEKNEQELRRKKEADQAEAEEFISIPKVELSEDIRRLMDELESDDTEDIPMEESPVSDEYEHENMGSVVESLILTDDMDEEEAETEENEEYLEAVDLDEIEEAEAEEYEEEAEAEEYEEEAEAEDFELDIEEAEEEFDFEFEEEKADEEEKTQTQISENIPEEMDNIEEDSDVSLGDTQDIEFEIERALREYENEDYSDTDSEEDEYVANEYAEDEYAEEEYAEDEYADDEYAEEEYAEDEYADDEYAEEEYAEDEYADDEYAEEEYADDEYAEEEYAEDEYADDEYAEEEYAEDEYADDEYAEEEYAENQYEEDYTGVEEDSEYEDLIFKDMQYEQPVEQAPIEELREEILEIEEPSPEEKLAQTGKFDTGFIVQGRYDLSATSEIGLKAGLTEEQKKLFSYFVPIRGVSEQIVEVLGNDKHCRNRYGTSRTGNILVIGRKGSGKTVLAVDIVKAIQKQRKLKQGKVAIVTGDSLNTKDMAGIISKLKGGALIIEKASQMDQATIADLNRLMEEQTGELLFVLEEQRKPLEKMLSMNPSFKRKFTSRLELPVFINDELVTFGQTYAKENGYRIDEMGILALYSKIDVMQREDHAVTVAEVKEIMDEAIEHSQKANVKRLMKRMFRRNTDESDRIILKEEDFM